MYPNQNAMNTMSYPNQVQNLIAENLLFQNQSNATIADIYSVLNTVMSQMDIPNTTDAANYVLGIIQPQIMDLDSKNESCKTMIPLEKLSAKSLLVFFKGFEYSDYFC